MKSGKRNLGLDYVALYQRYLGGESSGDIALAVGVRMSTLRGAWVRRGLALRSRSEAAVLRAVKHPNVMGPAHDAARGRIDSMRTREMRAITRQARCLGTSHLEDAVAWWLDQTGSQYVRQQAIGPYNVDFALPDLGIVIEVSGGGHNPRVRLNAPSRRAFIEGRGWRVVELSTKRGELTGDMVAHVSSGANERVHEG